MRNRALASLPGADFELLRPHLRTAELVKGEFIRQQGEPIQTLYFPLTGMISAIVHLEDGRSVEAGIIGPEGMIDVAALGSGFANADHLIQGSGEALTIHVSHLMRAMQASPAVARMVCLAAEISSAYALQSLACANFHQIEARFCRWMLMARHHLGSDTVSLTHEFMATMLGAQRSSVSTVANKLQAGGLISYRRGEITIRDVAGLQRLTCECYARVIGRMELAFPKPR